MALKKFVTVFTDDENLERLQSSLKSVLDVVTDVQILDGTQLTNVSVKTGQSNFINHGLGRSPLGWIVTRKKSAADVWDAQDDNKSKDRTLDLRSDADVTLDIWIF